MRECQVLRSAVIWLTKLSYFMRMRQAPGLWVSLSGWECTVLLDTSRQKDLRIDGPKINIPVLGSVLSHCHWLKAQFQILYDFSMTEHLFLYPGYALKKAMAKIVCNFYLEKALYPHTTLNTITGLSIFCTTAGIVKLKPCHKKQCTTNSLTAKAAEYKESQFSSISSHVWDSAA